MAKKKADLKGNVTKVAVVGGVLALGYWLWRKYKGTAPVLTVLTTPVIAPAIHTGREPSGTAGW